MASPNRPEIRVSCAIIEKNGQVLAAQRSPAMTMPLKWELPGGKIEAQESPEICLKREIFEELGIEIVILRSLNPVTHHYPGFTIFLYPFVCKMRNEKIHPREHSAIQWLPPETLKTLDWTEADMPIIEDYCRLIIDRRGTKIRQGGL